LSPGHEVDGWGFSLGHSFMAENKHDFKRPFILVDGRSDRYYIIPHQREQFKKVTGSIAMNLSTACIATNVRAILTLRETLVLAEISDVKKVRKDIESGWLTRRVISDNGRLWFRWADVIFLGAVYKTDILSAAMRKRALECFKSLECSNTFYPIDGANIADLWHKNWHCERKINLDNFLYLDLDKVFESVGPRVGLYAGGLKRIEERPTVVGGEAVFKNTRLPVLHVGKMYDRGESLENILEDYPYLGEDDVKFARLYYRAHPTVGRPRTGAQTGDDVEIDA
jgi:uncharacterized protein (DUF433 family)